MAGERRENVRKAGLNRSEESVSHPLPALEGQILRTFSAPQFRAGPGTPPGRSSASASRRDDRGGLRPRLLLSRNLHGPQRHRDGATCRLAPKRLGLDSLRGHDPRRLRRTEARGNFGVFSQRP